MVHKHPHPLLHQTEEELKGSSSRNGNPVKQATNHLHRSLLPLQ